MGDLVPCVGWVPDDYDYLQGSMTMTLIYFRNGIPTVVLLRPVIQFYNEIILDRMK